jgi:hypothetical protein
MKQSLVLDIPKLKNSVRKAHPETIWSDKQARKPICMSPDGDNNPYPSRKPYLGSNGREGRIHGSRGKTDHRYR